MHVATSDSLTKTASVGQKPMETLAARFRAAGAFVMTLDHDGRVTFHDPAAIGFFIRYVLPQVQFNEANLRQSLERASLTTQVVDAIPGAALAILPRSQDPRFSGHLVVAVKAETFSLGEDVLRMCGRIGIDGTWLAQQAESLDGFSTDELRHQARVMQATLMDQLQLVGLASDVESLASQLSSTYEELNLIYQMGSGMHVNRSPQDFFKKTCLEVMDLMGLRGVGVALRGDNGEFQTPAIYGSIGLGAVALRRLADELGEAMKLQTEPIFVEKVARDPRFNWLGKYARKFLAAPLIREDRLLGCLFGFDKRHGEFDTVDGKLLSAIANESAIFLENALLYDDVRSLVMGLLHSLVSAVDAKDTYTCGHSERVALLSRFLAQEAQLPEATVERIYTAGLLHDVGKIGVSEAVLQKPARLTPTEYEQIKLHPEIGARILADVKQLQDIIPAVMHHHERYDGKGYPTGLAGKDIPMMGRLICLADCFDAMTTSRTYRKAMPLEVALTELRRCAGTQFDPELTDVFLSVGAERIREVMADHKQRTKHLIGLQQSVSER
jgi:HD-GYP domain-containing protein (c-di-GMP phosphodiesterase class II)